MSTALHMISRSLRHAPNTSRLAVLKRSVMLPERRMYSMVVDNQRRGLLFKDNDSKNDSGKLLSKFWLRDNCRCSQCVHQDTMQRNFDTFQIPETIEAKDVKSTSDGLDITWSDSHESHYPWSWIQQTTNNASQLPLTNKDTQKLWGPEIGANPPEVSFNQVMNADTKGMATLTNNLRVYGFTFVTGTPATPEASEEVLASIGPIRNTHYGGFYDFVPDLALADTAYTNIALAAHTDTTYFTEPAGLQSFHLLSHTPPPNQKPEEALGGQSLLVDGFHAAKILQRESPADYEVLTTVKVPWHASGNQGVAIAPDQAYPVIEGGSDVHRVRWNNDDRGVIPLDADVEAWYRAARKWNEILRSEQSEYWFQLQPGRLLIFDNWRVLHGRRAFEGLRRICGAYINRDDFISRWKTTNFPQADVVAANMQLR